MTFEEWYATEAENEDIGRLSRKALAEEAWTEGLIQSGAGRLLAWLQWIEQNVLEDTPVGRAVIQALYTKRWPEEAPQRSRPEFRQRH